MTFYDFRQNNSGGAFAIDTDRGVSVTVIVEADSADEANEKAEGIGLYFDGEGDCGCCGNRWHPVDEHDGDDVPSVYGTPVEEYDPVFRWAAPDPEVFIHFADGSVRGVFV